MLNGECFQCDCVACRDDEFQCHTGSNSFELGRCIPTQYVCDGWDDCQDRSDEQNCSERYFSLRNVCLVYTLLARLQT